MTLGRTKPPSPPKISTHATSRASCDKAGCREAAATGRDPALLPSRRRTGNSHCRLRLVRSAKGSEKRKGHERSRRRVLDNILLPSTRLSTWNSTRRHNFRPCTHGRGSEDRRATV